MSSSIDVASSASRATIVATVGFMCLGLAGWMISMANAGWFEKVYPGGTSLLLPFSIVLAVVGILAFVDQRTLDAVIFLGGAGFLWSQHLGAGSAQPAHYVGWYAIIWAVYFFYLWLAALKADMVRMLFLLGLWLTLLAIALDYWGLGHLLMVIGGYIGLATSVLAIIVSASAILGRNLGTPAAAGGA